MDREYDNLIEQAAILTVMGARNDVIFYYLKFLINISDRIEGVSADQLETNAEYDKIVDDIYGRIEAMNTKESLEFEKKVEAEIQNIKSATLAFLKSDSYVESDHMDPSTDTDKKYVSEAHKARHRIKKRIPRRSDNSRKQVKKRIFSHVRFGSNSHDSPSTRHRRHKHRQRYHRSENTFKIIS